MPTTDCPPDSERWRDLRRRMVDRQCRQRGIGDDRVLSALERVPRHAFVPRATRGHAYGDHAMDIGHAQTISQPYIVARMSEAAGLSGGERVLDVGTGSGYQAAVLVELGATVCSVERIAALAAEARARLIALGYTDIEIRDGDGSVGWPPQAPFHAILVAAGAPEPPAALCDQLADGGRLVIPVGDTNDQQLVVLTRQGQRLRRRTLCPARFVPLIGAGGFAATSDRP